MQPKLKEVQIAKIAEVFNRSKLQMDAVCKMEKDLKNKTWKPLFDEKDGNGYLSYKNFIRILESSASINYLTLASAPMPSTCSKKTYLSCDDSFNSRTTS